jgi:hypothetical protein
MTGHVVGPDGKQALGQLTPGVYEIFADCCGSVGTLELDVGEVISLVCGFGSCKRF